MEWPPPYAARIRAVTHHHGLLGTVVELQVTARDHTTCEAVELAAIAEVERLQSVFDVHDDASELNRWVREGGPPSPELGTVIDLARRWYERSVGVFDPTVRALVSVWRAAADAGAPPTEAVLRQTIERAHSRSWAGGGLALDFNAIAKGWIVDRAMDAARTIDGCTSVTINAGGDLLHRGPEPIVVGIEDPHRPYDNAAPLRRIALGDGAVATSGGARRGWRIDGRWYSHVIDPRTGHPVDHIASASVIAPDAATADVIATVLSVVDPDEGLSFASGCDGAGCCIVTSTGEIHTDERWRECEISAR